MAYDVVSKDALSVLASSEVNQLQENFDALAAQDSGAPALDLSSFMAQVASIAQMYVESGITASEVSSFDTIEVNCLLIRGNPALFEEILSEGSDYTITLEDANGFKTIQNNSAGAALTYTLPGSGAKRVSITNVVSGATLTITTPASDNFLTDGQTKASMFLRNQGDSVTIARLVNYEWYVLYGTGSFLLSFDNGFLLSNRAATTAIAKIVLSSITESVIAATVGTGIANSCKSGGNLKGYSLGGGDTGTAIDDLDYSDESSTTLAATCSAGGIGAGVASGTNMYRLGMSNFGPTTTIDSVDFSDDSCTTLAETLDTAMSGGGACHNYIAGFCMAGGGSTNKIYKFTFSTELGADISATITHSDTSLGVNGWFNTEIGYRAGDNSYRTIVEDLVFEDETSDAIVETLDTGVSEPGSPNSGAVGLACGGKTGGGPTYTNIIQAFTYQGESMTTDAETMTTTTGYGVGACNEPT